MLSTVASYQRRRILIAAGKVFGSQGFDRSAVEDIVSLAGVSRRTFYELFDGKEDAFRTVHGKALDQLGERVGAACDNESVWSQRVAAGITVALRWAESEPSLARLVAGGPTTAGMLAADCHDLLTARFAPGLQAGRSSGSKAPPIQEEMLIAGLAAVVATHLGAADEHPLAGLAPQLIELTLLSYISPDEAKWIASAY